MNFKRNIIIAISSIFLFLLHSVNAAATQHSQSDVAIQNAVLVHINEYRRQHGLPKLTMDNNIVREAKLHSMDMATHRMPFGHNGFIKRITHLRSKVKNAGTGAENVAYNYKDARTVVQQWVLSPGHKRNIVGNYNLTGIGIARDKQGRIYYTQLFIRTNEQHKRQVARRPAFGVSFSGLPFRRSA